MKTGENFVLGEYTIIKYPELFVAGNGVRVSDFCRITAAVELGDHCEIACYTSVAGGGGTRKFIMKGYSSLAAGVRVWLSSNDYKNELVTHSVPGVREIEGDVVMELYSGVGTNSVIMPGVTIPEGTVVGALSFVPSGAKLDPWSIYAGCPVKKIGVRVKEQVLSPLRNKTL
ncbi:MAG: hypothetical protein FWG39_02600 [Alphaproteobacteria bacterium]|nr:hypothetical protein [Alphaproteobacteria bacterium]